jgi:hypothetical protein
VHELLEERFQIWIDESLLAGFSAKTLTLAFLGVVDSIFLELVYGNEQKRLEDKLEASWKIYWKGISQR